MAKKTIKKKPISNKEYLIVNGKHCLTDLILQTGARIQEIHTLINSWDEKSDYLDIHTKKSKDNTNRIYLTEEAKVALTKCRVKYLGMSVKTLSNHIKALSEGLGIKFTSHNLRATFATRLFERKVDIVTVSTLMNHSDISITAQYIQFSERTLRRGLSRLNDNRTYSGLTPEEMIEELRSKDSVIKELEAKLYN